MHYLYLSNNFKLDKSEAYSQIIQHLHVFSRVAAKVLNFLINSLCFCLNSEVTDPKPFLQEAFSGLSLCVVANNTGHLIAGFDV